MNLKSFLTNRWAVAAGCAVAAVLLLVVAPALLSSFRLGLLGKYLCYAMVAVGIGLAWGRGGMLVLGQGVFFGLGAYIMAMHLKLADAPPSTGVPDFMALISSDGVPVWWEPFRSGVVTLIAIVVVPTAVAVLLGLATFRRRVRGASGPIRRAGFGSVSGTRARSRSMTLPTIPGGSGNYPAASRRRTRSTWTVRISSG